MSDIKVKTGSGDAAVTVTVQYDVPETVADLVKKYGEEQTAALAGRAVTLAVQALVRQKIAAGSTAEEAQHAVDSWVPGVRGAITRKSPFERAQAALSGMSKEELAALLQKVKEAAKGA